MSTIIGLDQLKSILNAAQLEELDAVANIHKTQSSIEFSILNIEDNMVHLETAQSETRSGKYATEAALLKKTHEVFDKWLPGFTLQVNLSPFLVSPTSIVNPAWLDKKMLEKGVRIKQISFETGVERGSIADWIAGKRSMSQIVKAMFYFYFKSK